MKITSRYLCFIWGWIVDRYIFVIILKYSFKIYSKCINDHLYENLTAMFNHLYPSEGDLFLQQVWNQLNHQKIYWKTSHSNHNILILIPINKENIYSFLMVP